MFCRQRRIRCTRIVTAAHQRRADYRVRRPHARSVIVEVKQVEPNRAEQAAIHIGKKRGWYNMPTVQPGKRVRDAISDARAQLNSIAKKKLPALLVLYDVFPGRSNHTDPYSVLTAARGFDEIELQIPADRARSPTFGKIRPGRGGRLQPQLNTTISAIALMLRVSKRTIQFAVFHNRHTAVPLRVAELCGPGVIHYDMSQDRTDWIRRAAT
jgi:hypothetical protein